MDDRTYIGSLAEAKAIWYFTKEKYHVFNQVSGKAPYDLVVDKDGILYKVSVKGTSYQEPSGNYLAQLRKIRSNRTENRIIHFDHTEVDLVFIYAVPEDRFKVFKAEELKGLSTKTI